MALVLSGDGLISGLNDASIPAQIIGAGAVLQVAYMLDGTLRTNSAGSSAPTSMAGVTITPKSATSKFVLLGQTGIDVPGGVTNIGAHLWLMRNGVAIRTFTYACGYDSTVNSQRISTNPAFTVDTTAHTLAPITFNLAFATSNTGGTVKANSYAPSTLIVLEVA